MKIWTEVATGRDADPKMFGNHCITHGTPMVYRYQNGSAIIKHLCHNRSDFSDFADRCYRATRKTDWDSLADLLYGARDSKAA